MKYLLDTNAVSHLFDEKTDYQKYVLVNRILSSFNDYDEVCISVLTLFEMQYSLSNAHEDKKAKIQKTIDLIKQTFEILPVGISDDEDKDFGDLKAKYKTKKGISKENIKKFSVDIIIASSAIANNCSIVSFDKIFSELNGIDEKVGVYNI